MARKPKPKPKRKETPWEKLGISQRTYYRRRQKHDEQPPQPPEAGFLQDQLKQPNTAAAEVMYSDLQKAHEMRMAEIANEHDAFIAKVDGTPESAALGDAMRDAADAALVEEFLWGTEILLQQQGSIAKRQVTLSGRMIIAVYNTLKVGKGEQA